MPEDNQGPGFDIPFACCGTVQRFGVPELFRPAGCPVCSAMASGRALNLVAPFQSFPSDCIVEMDGAFSGEDVVLALLQRLMKHAPDADPIEELPPEWLFLCRECETVNGRGVAYLDRVNDSFTALIGAAALLDRPIQFADSKSKQWFRIVLLRVAPKSQKGPLLLSGSTMEAAARLFF